MNNKNNFIFLSVLAVVAGVFACVIIILFFDLKLLTLVAICEACVFKALISMKENDSNGQSANEDKSKERKSTKTIEKKSVTSEKISVTCQNFEDVRIALENSLVGYKLKTMERVCSNVFVFFKKRPFREHTMCFMVVDLRDEVRYPDRLFLHEVFPSMMNLDVQRPLHPIRVVLVICVNNRDRWLDTFVNNNLEHDFKLFKLPVVISFSEGEMYMARQKGGSGYGKTHYKKMRKAWLNIACDSGLVKNAEDGTVCSKK